MNCALVVSPCPPVLNTIPSKLLVTPKFLSPKPSSASVTQTHTPKDHPTSLCRCLTGSSTWHSQNIQSSPCPTGHPTVPAEVTNGNSILPGAQPKNPQVNIALTATLPGNFVPSSFRRSPQSNHFSPLPHLPLGSGKLKSLSSHLWMTVTAFQLRSLMLSPPPPQGLLPQQHPVQFFFFPFLLNLLRPPLCSECPMAPTTLRVKAY